MRSRYTAFVLGEAGYLARTWHSSTRPDPLDLAGGPRWVGLSILTTEGGGPGAEEGKVEFAARYREARGEGVLHETSRFVREEGRWVYLDGVIHPAVRTRAGRNDPCPCGSGRKFKQCCGR
jgi:SEC-C motif-containing protein